MRRSRLSAVLIGAGSLLALGAGASSASAAVSQPAAPAVATAAGAAQAGSFGTAIKVPGTATLNTSGNAVTVSVSCASTGNCSAGGFYTAGATQAFVVNEVDGTWGKAEEIPGTATLNQGGNAQVSEVSCASAGNCAVGGTYTDSSGSNQAFVASEANGTWGTAQQVPGTAALGGETTLDVLSCGSAGNCSAGGSYSDSSGKFQAFVASEASGTWGTAREVPGTAALNQGGDAHVGALSCASAGNCSAGGSYFDASGDTQVFVVNEAGGTWGAAQEVPGTATLNKGAIFGAQLFSVSCATAGNCATGGFYTDGSGDIVAFVASETSGTWGMAQEVPGIANQGFAQALSVSCASAGNCSAGGDFGTSAGTQAFVVNEANGTWGDSEQVPGIATLNTGGNAIINSVSCASAGNCAAAGSYSDASGHTQAFVASEASGAWGTAQEVPGTATLNKGGNATADSVSCAPGGNCSAGGSYSDKSFAIQAFVASES